VPIAFETARVIGKENHAVLEEAHAYQEEQVRGEKI
jgi:hypothetical protein